MQLAVKGCTTSYPKGSCSLNSPSFYSWRTKLAPTTTGRLNSDSFANGQCCSDPGRVPALPVRDETFSAQAGAVMRRFLVAVVLCYAQCLVTATKRLLVGDEADPSVLVFPNAAPVPLAHPELSEYGEIDWSTAFDRQEPVVFRRPAAIASTWKAASWTADYVAARWPSLEVSLLPTRRS